MTPKLADVFKTADRPVLPGRRNKSEVTQNILKGRDEQIYEPTNRTDEDGTGGMGGTTGGEDCDQETGEEEMDLAGAK